MKLVSRRLKIGLLASAGMLAAGGSLAFADQLIYATNEEGGQLYKVDVTTNSVTTLVNTGANPDSLVFSGSNILFTEVIQGNLSLFNTTTDTISNVATGFAQPRDIVLDPGGKTALVADYYGGDTGNGAIDRVDLTTGTVTPLFQSNGATYGVDGLAYDNKGNLFAVLGRHEIAQIDPTTGAILNQTTSFDGNLDGLTFDPTTGELWVGSENGAIWEVPTNLSGETSFPAGSIDGLEADGLGHIFLANFGTDVQEFTIGTSTLTDLTSVPGIDDLAPVIGGGAPPPPTVPEPGTIALLGTCLLGLAGFVRRKSA
jgi:YVTN family beta-propeller protein